MKTVDDYIHSFPKDVQLKLNEIRKIVFKYAPDAIETMSYGMPAYKTFNKPLVYFAGYKNHIGFYATPTGHTKFTEELKNYKQGKGSVQFPVDKALPIKLISKIVQFRVHENIEKQLKVK